MRAVHIPGHKNGPADGISRDNLGMFFAQVPAARTPVREASLTFSNSGV